MRLIRFPTSPRRRRNGKRTPAFLLALCLAALWLPLPASAAGAETAAVPVRVGYFYNGDFMHRDESGALAGYDIEYYYTVAGYAGWDLRFAEYDSLASALNALERGEIDMMSGLSRTDERESNYLVSAQKMCTAHISVQTRADDDRFAAGDTAAMAGLTCGILKGSNVVTLYEDWCGKNGLTPHIAEYDSLEERNAALFAGEVDAIAAGSTIKGAQKIAEFPSLDLYFMFNRDRSDLKAQTDKAMGILSLENPSYAESLFLKYFPSSLNDAPSFSAAEKAFIAAHASIRVAVLADDAPFSSTERDGSVSGILPDYCAHLSQVIGTTFVCVPYASKDACCSALAAGEADMIAKFENNVFDAYGRQVLITVPYLQMNLVQITRAGADSVVRAAVPACNAALVAKTLKGGSAPLEVTECANSADCFALLRSGGTDAVICTQPAAAWLLNRYRAADYVVSAFGAEVCSVSYALPSGAGGNTLRSILNQTLAVENGYMSQLITSDTLQDSADLASLFDRLPVSFLAAFGSAAALLLILAVIALILLIRRRQTERRLAAQQAALSAAQEANKARHAFFGAVSHDMRTPLNGILGFTHLALESDEMPVVRDYLGKIRSSGLILSGLVNDTLVMSRMENGKYTLNPTPADTLELLTEILEPERVTAEEKGVRFVDNVAETRRRTVLADRLSLQKILLNLLSNAIKFTPPGGTVTLNCRLDPVPGGPAESVISVSDTGMGISPEFLPHIFEPFAQERASNADASGSGMGLSIVKSIVDAMGGTIDVRTERGKGTVFTVRLTLPDADGPAPAAVPAPPQTDCLRGRRILVCEDNALNLEIVRTVLERRGMEVTGAANGKLGADAFAASAPGTFDAVLLDLRMPVLDGEGAARAIRALNRSDAETVPILAVSADAYPEDVRRCLDAGMNGHLSKPIEPEALYAALTDVLKPKT